MKRIINWIATDALIFILIFIICFSFIGFWSIVITIAVGKEIYDVINKPNYTWEIIYRDIICDIGGIVLVFLSLIIF